MAASRVLRSPLLVVGLFLVGCDAPPTPGQSEAADTDGGASAPEPGPVPEPGTTGAPDPSTTGTPDPTGDVPGGSTGGEAPVDDETTGGPDPSGGDPTGADPTGGDPTGGDPTGEDPTGGDPCNDNGICEFPEDPMVCPNDCQGGSGGPCNDDGICTPPEDPASCPNDCQGGGGPACNHNGSCNPGENAQSCPADCGGGGNNGGCNDNGHCDTGEDENNCPSDCMWWLAGVPTPDEVDPASIPPILEEFPAPDEAMCELPERCPGPVSTFVDPWTGAHGAEPLERSRLEIVQVDARGQRAWTYFSLQGLEGDSVDVYGTELADAMRYTLEGTTYPLESGSLHVHPARPGMWDYLTQAGQARIAASGYRGIDIDAGFFGSMCFDPDTVDGFGPWLAANLSPTQLQDIEDQLADRGFVGVTVDAQFDYQDHLINDRGFATENQIGGEDRLLQIDMQWDRYVDDGVEQDMDAYIADLQLTATSAGQGDFPVFLNRAEGDSIWTVAEKFDVLGGETFINDGNIHYPAAYRMAPYFRAGQVFGKRVWSWNFPRTLHPSVAERVMDTVLVYVAENDAAGGLLQIPDRSIKYPLCPPEEPLCSATDAEMAALWDKIGPYLTYREQIRDTLGHPSHAQTLVLEMLGLPHSQWNGRAVVLDFASLGTGALLGDYQIDYDVTGWADGDYRHRLETTPWVTQQFLDSYPWIVLAEPEFLSEGQVAMLNAYMAQGGKLLVLLYSDDTCTGGDENACILKPGCRWDAAGPSCTHAIDGLSGTAGTNLFVIDDIDVIDYRDEPTSRSTYRARFDAAMTGVDLPQELTSASDLADVGVFHSRRGTDGAHIWQLVNYGWSEGTYASVPRAAATVELAVPTELQGQTVNVTWLSAPDQREELLTGVTAGARMTVTVPAFDIWGSVVMTTGAHEMFSDPRARPPYVKVSSYQPGQSMDWEFQFEAVSSHASLDRAYLWGRELVETSPGVWDSTGDWKAVYEYDFTQGGTIDPGRAQTVQFAIPRPDARLQLYATACDEDGLCQPFIPWAVLTRPPSP